MNKQASKSDSCKLHEQLIQQLLNENVLIKQKYEALLREHEKLKHKYNKLSQQAPNHAQQQLNNSIDIHDIISTHIADIVDGNKGNSRGLYTVTEAHNQDSKILKSVQATGQEGTLLTVAKTQKLPPQVSLNNRRTSSRTSRSSSVSEKFFPFIEGCFIIEKKKCYAQKSKTALQQMVQYIYPEELIKTQKQTIQMMLKYTFDQPQVIKVQDDQFNSRRNQVLFGTPYEDYTFGFQDGKWVGKRELPEIMKLMGTMKKKYYHILVKPQIISKNQMQSQTQSIKTQALQAISEQKVKDFPKLPIEGEQDIMQQNSQYFYQTEIIFGFISSFPLRLFFQDLHRTLQQQLKYSQLSLDEKKQQIFNPLKNRKSKYKILGQIMKKLYDQEYKVNRFPFKFSYNTGISTIQLNIPTVINHRQIEDDFLNQVLAKYDGLSICKLLHYVLTEKCILIESDDKRSLNELLDAIRIMIRPFLWMFAIVYVYSDYFEPFMSSPMPIIIGKIEESQEQEQSKSPKSKRKSVKVRQNSVQYSDFCVVKLNGEEDDLKQKDLFYKAIKKLKKQWDKAEKDRNNDKATLIHKYVHGLRVFIEKGVINNEPTDFHIQFIDTQMVSYFKDTRDEF